MDILNNIRYGVELERAQMPDNGLNESPGWWNSMWGSISGASQQGVDNKRAAVDNAAGNRLLEQSGYTRGELGLKPGQRITEGTVGSAVRTLNETKADQKSETAFNRSLVPLTKQLEASTTESRLNRESQADQFRTQLASQDARYAHTDKQNRLDRGLERELASNSQEMNLAIAQMNSDLADKRMDYDRETARMDKRSAAIAQLMSGLGSLGGAFSL
jgi:hypothetical protein